MERGYWSDGNKQEDKKYKKKIETNSYVDSHAKERKQRTYIDKKFRSQIRLAGKERTGKQSPGCT
jgi:hypothetical protein